MFGTTWTRQPLFWPEHLGQGLSITAPTSDGYSYLLSAQEAARTILQAISKAVEQPLGEERTRGEGASSKGKRSLSLFGYDSFLNSPRRPYPRNRLQG